MDVDTVFVNTRIELWSSFVNNRKNTSAKVESEKIRLSITYKSDIDKREMCG